MKTKTVLMRKSSGFNYSITASIIDTAKGKIRTIEIIDHEVMMADLEPSDKMVMICNDMDLDTNKEQLKEFCKFMLKELKS